MNDWQQKSPEGKNEKEKKKMGRKFSSCTENTQHTTLGMNICIEVRSFCRFVCNKTPNLLLVKDNRF